MTTKLNTEDIRGDSNLPSNIDTEFRGGSCGNLITGVIDGSKIACAGLRADRLSAAMLGGEDMSITAGTIDARDLSRVPKK